VSERKRPRPVPDPGKRKKLGMEGLVIFPADTKTRKQKIWGGENGGGQKGAHLRGKS